jgi:large subunit ribosomal protein L19e
MNLKNQRRVAAELLKVGEKRIWFDNERLSDIKEAITKDDIRALIRGKAIQKRPEIGNSKVRARKIKLQKSKGRRKGKGSRKGKKTARLSSKEAWMSKIRAQRKLLKELREKKLLKKGVFNKLYLKAKGGFFRSRRHIMLYLKENNYFNEKKNDTKVQKKKTG